MASLNTYQRAIQIYQVLIAAAYQRQTLTYELVGERVGLPPVGVGNHLEHLKVYCEQHELPPLTVLVVRKDDGTPSSGYGGIAHADVERERVFAYEWHKHPPITEDDLRSAPSRRAKA